MATPSDAASSAPAAAWVRENRIARWLTALATLWFVLAAGWELFGPPLAGHYASSASVGIIADNMRSWGIAGPVWEYTSARPTPDQYYCHHPFGIFWTTRVLMAIFGRHDFVCRLAPVLLSAATPPLLFALGRALYRPIAGASAACAFVVVPIALSFSAFNALEVPVIAWSTMLLLGWVRFVQRGRARDAALAVAGAILATNADWPGFLVAAFVLGMALLRLFAGRFLAPRGDDVRVGRFFAVLVVAVTMVGFGYAYAFHGFGKLTDLLGAYGFRSQGNETSLARVLASRRYWLEVSFGPIVIALGKLFVPIAVVRALLGRRDLELVPLGVLFMAGVQYVVFRQGADIHVFWPHYFALYFALAFAGTVSTALDLGALVGRRLPGAVRAVPVAIAVLATVLLVAVLRDGVAALAYARATGGRFNEKGNFIDSDGDKIVFASWAAGRVAPDRRLVLDPSLRTTWSVLWAIGRPAANDAPVSLARGFTGLCDTRFLSDETRAVLLGGAPVETVGPYWIVGGEAGPGLVSNRFVDTEPSPFTWYFVSGNEPVRNIEPDPFGRWELAAHYGLPLPELPAPTHPEARRIAHNAAVARGDEPEAARLLAELSAEGRPVDATFDDGTTIVAVLGGGGVDPRMRVLVKPAGPLGAGVKLSVTSRVVAPPRWSFTMADPTVREHAYPFGVGPARFRRGFVYAVDVAYRARPGTDALRASFVGPGAPRPAGGTDDVALPPPEGGRPL